MIKSNVINFVLFFCLSVTTVVRATKYDHISSCSHDTTNFYRKIVFKCAEDNREDNIFSNNETLRCDYERSYEDYGRVRFTNCRMRQINRDWFITFRNLDILNVSDTELEKINETNFLNAKKLSAFIASNNRLTEIRSHVFANSKKLSDVDLSNNTITRIDPLAFGVTNKVETLNLSFNSLGDLQIETFAYLTELKHLDLRRANITAISLGTFSHQHQLTYLDLSENQLKKLDFNLFLPNLPHLLELYLNQNQLRELVGFRNDIFPQLEKLDIKNNPFNCSYLYHFMNSVDWNGLRLPVNSQSTDVHKYNIRGINCEGEIFESKHILPATDEKSPAELQSKIYGILISKLDALQNASNENVPKINQNSNSNESFLLQFSLILMCTIQLIFLAVFLFTKRNKLFKLADDRRGSSTNQTVKYSNEELLLG